MWHDRNDDFRRRMVNVYCVKTDGNAIHTRVCVSGRGSIYVPDFILSFKWFSKMRTSSFHVYIENHWCWDVAHTHTHVCIYTRVTLNRIIIIACKGMCVVFVCVCTYAWYFNLLLLLWWLLLYCIRHWMPIYAHTRAGWLNKAIL